MSPAATAAAALAVLGGTALFGVLLAIWLPMWAALVLTPALLADEARRGWRRWRVSRTWATRLSA